MHITYDIYRKMPHKVTSILFMLVSLLGGCASIQEVGEIGPKKLKVYSIAHSDFLTASRMIIVIDDKGDLKASSGGTVVGGGTVGLQTMASLAGAGAIIYGAKAIQHGMENALPSDYKINTNTKIHISGEVVDTK